MAQAVTAPQVMQTPAMGQAVLILCLALLPQPAAVVAAVRIQLPEMACLAVLVVAALVLELEAREILQVRRRPKEMPEEMETVLRLIMVLVVAAAHLL